MIWLYRVLLNLAIPFGLLGLFLRGFKNPDYWRRWSERFGFPPRNVVDAGPFDLWIHAVSVGEARAATPLVLKVLEQNPHAKVLVTTTTPTGSAMVKMQLKDQVVKEQVSHCYFPYDLAWAMNRFVKTVSAKTVLVMETEIWPNMIQAVKNQGGTLLYINVRLSERSYAKYARVKKWASATLNLVDHFSVQGDQDRQHLIKLGVAPARISQTGSIKFDIEVAPSLLESAEVVRRWFGPERLIWIAGSTRENEESKVLAVYKQLKESMPSLLLVLVPRHPERFDSVARQVQRLGLDCVRRSQQTDLAGLDFNTDVYLGDTMGELSLLYAAADVAFVGGSLEPLGGQNILEPCALGVPVVFGPHMFNFPDISRWTIQEGAGVMVENEARLFQELADLLGNPSKREKMGRNGLRFVHAHRGALKASLALLKRWGVH